MKTYIGVLVALVSVAFSNPAFAQASDNPNSAYAVCHGSSPPSWCTEKCGPLDTWCEFAGLRCTFDNPFFEMLDNVKGDEFTSEECTDDMGATFDWCDEGVFESDMEDYLLEQTILQCVSLGQPRGTCEFFIGLDGSPSCSWEDWYCANYSAPLCLNRGT